MSARVRSMALLVAVVFGAVGIAAGGASSALIKKVTLTVVVNGNGGVVSKPAGISCPTACKLKVKMGSHVVLTAKPDSGSQLGSWSGGCGAKATCRVTMTKSKTVTVSFKTPPPPPPTTTTPPPPPPPPAKSGHYTGTYSDGSDPFVFDVASTGTSVGNFSFSTNGHCSKGGVGYGTLVSHAGANGPYTIQSDGSFTGSTTGAGSGGGGTANFTINLAGKFAQDGTATGTLSVTVAFVGGSYDGISCTSSGTWTAKVGT